MSTKGKRTARKRRRGRRPKPGRPLVLPRPRVAAEASEPTRSQEGAPAETAQMAQLHDEALPTPANRVPGPRASRDIERERHRNVEPLRRNMTVIDFLVYVVSSPVTSMTFVMILFASAILVGTTVTVVAIVASHVHIGVTGPITKDGLTVGLTSAGTVIVAAIALARRRGRRGSSRRQDDDTKELY